MRHLLFCLCLLSAGIALTQDHPAYVIYNSKGKKVSYAKMEKALLEKKYVFFGELHNDPIAHWMQLTVLKALHRKHGDKLMAGSEMFERDNHRFLEAYQQGALTDKQFEDSCRLWPNYKTDYKPMLLYANQNKIPWIATNIPRRYASMVFKKGPASLDSLPAREKEWIAPLPFPLDSTLSQYAAFANGGMHMGPNFVRAQAIKDATMGYFIVRSLKPNTVFYHLEGAYHSDFHQGILWYVQHYGGARPEEMITISTVSQENVSKLDQESYGKADFIICVPESMTKTH